MSCKEKLRRGRNSQSGVYHLLDPETNSMYETYCDFTSENGFVWTLVESFSLANNQAFKPQAFFKDHPVNQKSFSWKIFRLSTFKMTAIADHSTHVRATCNFDTDGLNYTDYLRAKLSEINVTDNAMIDKCKRYEYIDIRGYGCSNCAAPFYQSSQWHPHVDSYYGSQLGCGISFPGAILGGGGGEDNFGVYQTFNTRHRCSSNGNSTTQWWFGEQ